MKHKIVKHSIFLDVENKLMVTNGEWWGGGVINWETGIGIYTQLYIK